MKLDTKIVTSRLERNIDRLVSGGMKSRSEVLDKTMVMFLQSAAKLTPPGKGNSALGNTKGVPMDMRRRKILEYPLRGRGYTKFIYRVFIRRRGRPRVMRESYNPTDLKKYLPMDYRGIGKAGWWAGLATLGASTAGYYAAKKVRPILSSLNRIKKSPWRGYFQYIKGVNKVKEISRFGDLAAKLAFHKTAKRLAWWSNSEIKKAMAQSWRRTA